MANPMLDLKTDQFTKILEHMHPLIAKRRIRELDTNAKVLRATPFNGDHIAALREVLEEIARREKVDIKSLTSRLMSRSWPDPAYYTLQAILDTAAPITDAELRSACLCYFNKHTAKVFDNSRPFASDMTYQSFGDKLVKYFACSTRDERKLLKIIDGLLKHSHTDDRLHGKIRREALYFYLVSHSSSGYPSSYHDSDILRLAGRCGLHVAMYAVSWIKESCQPSSQLRRVIRCMEKGSRTMSRDYITELSTLVRQLDAKEATIFFEAVDAACAQLHSLPRHIARNYLMALRRGGWGYVKASKSEVATAIYRNVDKAKVQPILEEMNVPCGPNFTGAHRMIPASLSDAPVDLLIELNYALLVYLEKKGWTREGGLMWHLTF